MKIRIREMKKLGILFSTLLLIAIPALASDLRLDLNGGLRNLSECGGTIEATSTNAGYGESGSIHLTVRNVVNCSNFILETTGQEYKIPGPNGDRTGSFTLSTGHLDYGWNQVRLTVRSNSGAHSDSVAIWVNVIPNYTPVTPTPVPVPVPVPVPGNGYGYIDYYRCFPQAKSAAQNAFIREFGHYGTAQANFEHVSNKDNFVYSVSVQGSGYFVVYKVVTSQMCALKDVSRKN